MKKIVNTVGNIGRKMVRIEQKYKQSDMKKRERKERNRERDNVCMT